jgi:beta-phosphoglucomutase family hydrolase
MYKLNLQNIDAIIFDMDGTMVDNGSYHKKAWAKFCKIHGIEYSKKIYEDKISSRKNNQILSNLFEKDLTENQIIESSAEKEIIYRKLYEKEIREISGLTDFINKLKEKNLKMAIATTSPKPNRRLVLKALGLESAFDLIIGSEHVVHGKPNPEIYLQTARELNVNPAKCLVFEDSPVGVEAAKNAGMRVVGILTTYTKIDLQAAEICMEDFSQLEIA